MDTDAQPGEASTQHDEYARSHKGRFRFKVSKPSRRPPEDTHRRRHGYGRHRHRHSPRASRHENQPAGYEPRLSPETAFRESLFDALGDDEGAEYWESVYGQPIHTYAVPNVPKGPQGELEQMSDEEYATYVRSRMWERTREGMMEEQERLRQERMKQKQRDEENERNQYERARFERAMDESLRRGRERRRKKAWGPIWDEYYRCWGEIDRLAEVARRDGNEKIQNPLRNLIFWPVESGKRRDVSHAAVEEFIRHAHARGPEGDGDAKASSDDDDVLLATLKSERVRWHPDKIQHRYGVLGIDDIVLRSVTEVFQIVDRMWNELREKAG